MDHHGEAPWPPRDLMVHDGLLIPCCVMVNHDAYNRIGVTETNEFMVAYTKCTVPQQRVFRCFAELDSQIVRQLEDASLSITLVPNLLAKIHRLASRIRNEWTVKYGLKFRDQGPNDGMAPHGLLQLTGMAAETVDVLPTGMKHPVTGSEILTRYTPPAGTMRIAGGGAFLTFPAGYEVPNMAPGVSTPPGLPQPTLVEFGKYVMVHLTGNQLPDTAAAMPLPSLPPADLPHLTLEFGKLVNVHLNGNQPPYTAPAMPLPYMPPNGIMPDAGGAPPPAGPPNFGTPANFPNGSIPPKPLFADGQEPRLTWFEKFTSLNEIRLPEKREKTLQIQKNLFNESVARCMEALFRCSDQVEDAEAWLRETS